MIVFGMFKTNRKMAVSILDNCHFFLFYSFELKCFLFRQHFLTPGVKCRMIQGLFPFFKDSISVYIERPIFYYKSISSVFKLMIINIGLQGHDCLNTIISIYVLSILGRL